MNLKDFEISNDFMTNVEHILSCEIYVGGDTGMSHFASVLNNGPKISYYSPRSSDLFVPFYKDKIEFNSLS
jgi:ADP-heptose:LPS heptosyltransferase